MAFPITIDIIKSNWQSSEQPIWHSTSHNLMAVLLWALQTKIGINGSVDTNSIDYQLSQKIWVVANEIHLVAWGGIFIPNSVEVSSFFTVTWAGNMVQFQTLWYWTWKVFTSDVNGNATWAYPNTLWLTSKNVNYTFVISDSGKGFIHDAADTTARTYTIPANSSVAYPIWTTLSIINDGWAWVITISITTDTMVFAPGGTTWSRILAANWNATIVKITSTKWQISGFWLT